MIYKMRITPANVLQERAKMPPRIKLGRMPRKMRGLICLKSLRRRCISLVFRLSIKLMAKMVQTKRQRNLSHSILRSVPLLS